MKSPLLFFLLAAILVTGCQENSPIVPTSPDPPSPTFKKVSPVDRSIDFSYMVSNPYKSPQELLEVSGRIRFQLRQSPILHKELYDLTCVIEGQVYTIKPKELLGWSATKSSDQIDFSFQDKAVVLLKTMPVEETKTPLQITVELLVHRTGIQVSNVWLSLPDAETI